MTPTNISTVTVQGKLLVGRRNDFAQLRNDLPGEQDDQ